VVDEVRVSSVARSIDWLGAAHATVAENKTFCNYGAVIVSLGLHDFDNDGLPDAWEIFHFGETNSSGDAFSDSDRASDGEEYIAGTDPTDPLSVFALRIVWSNGLPVVRFLAIEAAGVGYDGLSREYDLEFAPDGALSPWGGVAGYTNIPGSNQTIEAAGPTNAPGAVLYRARTRLSPAE